MARSKIPNALEMRELKYGDLPDTEKDRVAEELRAEGRRAEAILLFQGRADHPFLADEARWAVAEGNGFHLVSLARMGRPVGPEELRACARSAEQRGRWMDARLCYVELGDEAAVQAVREHLPPTLRPEPPPEAQG
jgi:sirohydrochlorin ferrochelatase